MDRLRRAQKRRQLREQAVAYKGGRCAICRYDRCISAFDFHHTNGAEEKDFNISDRMTSFEAIRPELDKCVLLCATCHREVHDGMHPQYLFLGDSARSQYDSEDKEGHLSYEEEQEIQECLRLAGEDS